MGVRYQLAFPGHPVPLIGQFLPKWLVTDGAINLTFFPMHNLGLNGMMRRIADPRLYDHLRSQQPINIFIGLCAFGLGLSTVPFLINFVYSMFKGPKAPKNPWNATTLEWTLRQPLLDAAKQGNIALLFSAHDTEHNNAVVLKSYLEEGLTGKKGRRLRDSSKPSC